MERRRRRVQSNRAAQRCEDSRGRLDDAAIHGTGFLGGVHRSKDGRRDGYGRHCAFSGRSESRDERGAGQRTFRHCAAQPFFLRRAEGLFHAHRR